MSDEQELLATAPDARDVTAELAAPPRRKLPWITLALSGCVIAVVSFAGGVWYEKGDSSSTSAAGPRAGGQGQGQGGFGGQNGTGRRSGGGQNGQGQGQGGGFGGQNGGGFTRGTVKAVDGTTVYLTDAQGNTIKVTTGDSTKVTMNKEGKVADLQPGQSVTVVGTKGADGGYTATQLSEGAAGFGGGRPGAGAPSNG
ncbi:MULTISPECIES: DUF5666 domain-containing protein [Kitasatospora]|uniref:DUF5666 domain-containing protein n=2 Tax=Kitasatospora TaxID=2063 RepID=A0ABT1J745_9ACTN|nr:DUF5666 domain-containing protein [Kitasatospora paracochleata]MCP2313260.1 hypothetical protein [Kitasatospora paracochleata]